MAMAPGAISNLFRQRGLWIGLVSGVQLTALGVWLLLDKPHWLALLLAAAIQTPGIILPVMFIAYYRSYDEQAKRVVK